MSTQIVETVVTYEDASSIRNVLVAVHDPAAARLIADLLHEAGHSPMVVAATHDAVLALAANPIDLVLIDARSPLYAVLRACWPDVAVLALAGDETAISPAALLDAVRDALPA